MEKVLIDCGTTYLKIVELTQNNETIGRKSVSAEGIQQKVEIIKGYLEKFVSVENVKVNVAIATEMHGFILVNENGEELCDYVSWTHECPSELLEEIRTKTTEEWINNTGMPLKPGIASTSLYEMLKYEQRLFDNAIF